MPIAVYPTGQAGRQNPPRRYCAFLQIAHSVPLHVLQFPSAATHDVLLAMVGQGTSVVGIAFDAAEVLTRGGVAVLTEGGFEEEIELAFSVTVDWTRRDCVETGDCTVEGDKRAAEVPWGAVVAA